ncbi:MAG TPA: CopG family transcriptional regulator [Ignavibacteriaceae bacterium]|nr:CopG family transcriptional regulator [Ignavibacteriaceae bacterium]
MNSEAKRATIYLDPDLHRALKIKAAESSVSVSEIIERAIRRELSEDQEDLKAFKERENEGTISFEKVLDDLKRNGKI